MKEYWVNVYSNNVLGYYHWTREDAANQSNGGMMLLYRIHVTLK